MAASAFSAAASESASTTITRSPPPAPFISGVRSPADSSANLALSVAMTAVAFFTPSIPPAVFDMRMRRSAS